MKTRNQIDRMLDGLFKRNAVLKNVDQDSDRVGVSKADTKIIHEQGELTRKTAQRVIIGVRSDHVNFSGAETVCACMCVVRGDRGLII